jgi:integrase
MRRSELLALRWSDTDVDLAKLWVTRSFHRLRDGTGVFQAPKSAKGRRLISLPPSATEVLREHRAAQEKVHAFMGTDPCDDDLVFAGAGGSPLLPDSVTHAWVKLARRTGLDVRFHDARHTHATLMLKQNVRPKVVQERLGHASIATTSDIYSHVLPGMQEEAAIGFDRAVAEARNGRRFEQDSG